jgi:RND family efflux transporter MFP subunit
MPGTATPGAPQSTSPETQSGAAPAIATDAPLPDVVITLTKEAVERAGITVSPVGAGAVSSGVRVPGVIEPNAYRQVVVTPLVAGRVTRVQVVLGEQVRRGQTMAQVFSPELAEAQTRYISARAALEAQERELQRTQKLVEIGAASRQELERTLAVHTAQATAVQSARSRLVLLGVSAASIDALNHGKDVEAVTNIPAPIAGVVTERHANVGLNVDTTTKLFTVVDLSTVWIIGDLYEKDFARVRVGSPAAITITAYQDLALKGRVTYIDPQVDPEARTARVRVEVANPRNQLRLGMYAEMLVGEPTEGAVAMVPKRAVQNVGDRYVVYLVDPNQSGRFTEREVQLGEASADQVEILSGVHPGDVVVADGSFFLRAERERLGLRRPPAGGLREEGKL